MFDSFDRWFGPSADDLRDMAQQRATDQRLRDLDTLARYDGPMPPSRPILSGDDWLSGDDIDDIRALDAYNRLQGNQ